MTVKDSRAAWLRDAHAMERQAATLLETQIDRPSGYPEAIPRLRQHLEETRDDDRAGGKNPGDGALLGALRGDQGSAQHATADDVVKGAEISRCVRCVRRRGRQRRNLSADCALPLSLEANHAEQHQQHNDAEWYAKYPKQSGHLDLLLFVTGCPKNFKDVS